MARKARDKKYKLSVYLIKEDYLNYNKILKDINSLIKYDIKGYLNENMVLFVKKSRSNLPGWIEFFQGMLDKELPDLLNSSSSAVLFVKCDKYYFAYTFGYGHNLINPSSIVESFGLKISLNSIDRDKIRSVDTKSLDTVLRSSKIQTSQVSSVDSFGMDIEKDILKAVTGISNDSFFGKQISGSDALYLGLKVKVIELDPLCKRLLEKFNDKSYKDKFPWVDYITGVKNPAQINELNDTLVKVIKSKNFENLFLAIPNLVDWEQIEGFKYSLADEGLREDIYISDILPPDEKIEEKVTLKWLKTKEVLCIGKDGEQIVNSWPLFKCINYESKKGADTFLLTDGEWFKLDTNYIDSINEEIGKVNGYKGFSFPKYAEKGEGEYNQKVYDANNKICFLMDKKNISYGGGKSKIEFCDLIINKTDFVHIKRFRGSSALSHLFFQGNNSATIFLSDRDFREEINKYLPADWIFKDVIESSDYEIVFAIISKAPGKIKDVLPFFSKISFLQIYKQLKLYKYKVSLIKIETQTD
ncbi:MAG: TIGR04141 family sporadically distributed protein [bacterium]|nr:TIGR04141 family sporadically distributed protein [bacterium]